MRNPYAAGQLRDVTVLSDVTPPGNPIKEQFESYYDGSSIRLRSVGTINAQKAIQLEGPYSDLEYMLHKLKLGDTSVLTQKPSFFGDFSQLPKNPVDVINIVTSAKEAFEALPVEKKREFNNDWKSWLAKSMEWAADAQSAPGSMKSFGKSPVESSVKPVFVPVEGGENVDAVKP
nr:MAG TPA: Scaffold protein [Microviridae sp.]